MKFSHSITDFPFPRQGAEDAIKRGWAVVGKNNNGEVLTPAPYTRSLGVIGQIALQCSAFFVDCTASRLAVLEVAGEDAKEVLWLNEVRHARLPITLTTSNGKSTWWYFFDCGRRTWTTRLNFAPGLSLHANSALVPLPGSFGITICNCPISGPAPLPTWLRLRDPSERKGRPAGKRKRHMLRR